MSVNSNAPQSRDHSAARRRRTRTLTALALSGAVLVPAAVSWGDAPAAAATGVAYAASQGDDAAVAERELMECLATMNVSGDARIDPAVIKTAVRCLELVDEVTDPNAPFTQAEVAQLIVQALDAVEAAGVDRAQIPGIISVLSNSGMVQQVAGERAALLVSLVADSELLVAYANGEISRDEVAQLAAQILVAPTPPKLSDVSEEAWYYAPVSWMVDRGITVGYQNGTFKPSQQVTRGQAVTFLYRYADEDFTVPTEPTFKDVPVSHNQFEAISWASTNGVVNGYKGNVFRPGQSMTRGEVAAVLYRQADPEFTAPAQTKFSDVVKGQTGHYEAIAWLTAEKIANGRSNDTFNPHAQVTRAEFAAFLQRYDAVLTD